MPVGTVLVAHPSADLYGSDLQLLETVRALSGAGWRVEVFLPGSGPLVDRMADAGAQVTFLRVPVLRKSLLRPGGLVRLLVDGARALPPMIRLLRSREADVVYVNTVTIPLWLLAARLARRPALCHVHEAEEGVPRAISMALNAPLLLARTVVVNSEAAASSLLRAVPALRARTEVIYNGIAGPTGEIGASATRRNGPRHLVLVGRLAPRKGTDVALEAVAQLRAEGRDVDLELCGSVFDGYEWFEEQLRTRASAPDLAGHVRFAGYTSPTWPALARADAVLVPSRAEPFGNAAVEAQLANRPVVASEVQGLREIVTSEETGLLVPADDPAALAAAIGRLLDDEGLAAALAAAGRTSALARFTPDRYRAAIVDSVDRTSNPRVRLTDSDVRPLDETAVRDF